MIEIKRSSHGEEGIEPLKIKTYQLFINVKKDLAIQIGKLGKFNFKKGQYVYTGSAKKNMEKRIARHLIKDKNLRWHIDYLLARSDVQVTRIKRSSQEECTLNQKEEGEFPIKGFGSSDCRNGCVSHLKYLGSLSSSSTLK